MTARVSLHLDGQMDHLRLAWQAGETLLSDVRFEEDPKGTRYNILLAMQELLTNVFRHGYQTPSGQLVEVRFESTEHAFEFEIRDQAPGFDPTSSQKTPDDGKMPEEGGGYGLVIVKAVMDAFEYRRENGWNITRASKLVGASVAVGAPGELS